MASLKTKADYEKKKLKGKLSPNDDIKFRENLLKKEKALLQPIQSYF